jgi:hypothetical protein
MTQHPPNSGRPAQAPAVTKTMTAVMFKMTGVTECRFDVASLGHLVGEMPKLP